MIVLLLRSLTRSLLTELKYWPHLTLANVLPSYRLCIMNDVYRENGCGSRFHWGCFKCAVFICCPAGKSQKRNTVKVDRINLCVDLFTDSLPRVEGKLWVNLHILRWNLLNHSCTPSSTLVRLTMRCSFCTNRFYRTKSSSYFLFRMSGNGTTLQVCFFLQIFLLPPKLFSGI